jgi:hypothetical protein
MFGKDQSLTYKRTQLEHSGIRKIATELAARGHLTGSGKPHVASAIQRCLVGRAASRPPGPNPAAYAPIARRCFVFFAGLSCRRPHLCN